MRAYSVVIKSERTSVHYMTAAGKPKQAAKLAVEEFSLVYKDVPYPVNVAVRHGKREYYYLADVSFQKGFPKVKVTVGLPIYAVFGDERL